MLLPNPEVGLQFPAHGARDRHVALAVNYLAKLIEQLDQAGAPSRLVHRVAAHCFAAIWTGECTGIYRASLK
jgi:hypothetical protein